MKFFIILFLFSQIVWSQARITFFAPNKVPPLAPTLVFPDNGAIDRDTSLSLHWNTAATAFNYHLQVATDAGFTALVVDDMSIPVIFRQVNGLLFSSTVYHWRVRAENNAGFSPYSTVRNFTTLAVSPPQPTNLSIIPGVGYITFGMGTPAGSGRNLATPSTTVIHVTNLDDTGAGSLRDAMTQTGPRTVVFDTSGILVLNTRIILADSNSYLTVAGQTAPGPLVLKGSGIFIRLGHDVLLEHFEIRNNSVDEDALGTGIFDSTAATRPGFLVYSHLSVSWGEDEVLSMTDGTHHSTLRYSIVAEGIDPHSRGLMLPQSNHILVEHNLLMHNHIRNPIWGATGQGQPPTSGCFLNNIVYNWDFRGTHVTKPTGGIEAKDINIIFNKYINGVDSNPTGSIDINGGDTANAPYHVQINGNMLNGVIYSRSSTPDSSWILTIGDGESYARVDVDPQDYITGDAMFPAGFVITPVTALEDTIKKYVGPYPAARADSSIQDPSPWDVRYMDELTNKTGQGESNRDDYGGGFAGHPVVPAGHILNVPANFNDIIGAGFYKGYTEGEAWLDSIRIVKQGGTR